MSGFFIIRENKKDNQKVWEVMEHNNRSPAEGLHVASFQSKEMAENYVKNYFDKDDRTRLDYYDQLDKLSKKENP